MLWTSCCNEAGCRKQTKNCESAHIAVSKEIVREPIAESGSYVQKHEHMKREGKKEGDAMYIPPVCMH